MIIHRLYDLARRERLLDEAAFEDKPVPFLIQLGPLGEFLGILKRREIKTIPSKKKGADPKTVEDRGIPVSAPRAHGNTAAQGFACFLVDTIPRVVPFDRDLKSKTDAEKQAELEKFQRSRTTFWKQIDLAADQTDDPALRAVQNFGRELLQDDRLRQRVQDELVKNDAAAADRCSFAWEPDGGAPVVEREQVRNWFRDFYASAVGEKQEAGPTGHCQITDRTGPIPRSHPIKLSGIPGGLPTGVSLVSFDKAAFESYSLDGAANASIGYEAADGYARAIQALVNEKLTGKPRSKLKIGGTLFLFWTRYPDDSFSLDDLDQPTDESVAALLDSPFRGDQANLQDDVNRFHCLALSGNAARVVVRDYLEEPLPGVREHLKSWFADLRIADASKKLQGIPTAAFPIWLLAAATALDLDSIAADVPVRLMNAAVKGDQLPDSLLAACLNRLRAEGKEGFRPARLALMKLHLLRRNIPMTETLDVRQPSPAYVCGRLLSVFEQIQFAALGDIGAGVVEKYFGSFAAAPGTVLGRLYSNAQNHLSKLRSIDEKKSAYFSLDARLAEVSALLSDPPIGQLSLIDQARLALGYYHEKARGFQRMAENKARKAESAADRNEG